MVLDITGSVEAHSKVGNEKLMIFSDVFEHPVLSTGMIGLYKCCRVSARQPSHFCFGKSSQTNDALPGHIGWGGREPSEGSPTRGACPEFCRRARTRPAEDESILP